jgi:hypothetical protein
MSHAALSVRWFAAYMYLLGAALVTIPNLMLHLFAIPPTGEVWIRVAGVLVFNIGNYYWFAAPAESASFFISTAVSRTFVLCAFSAFVVLGFAKPVLIAIGSVDFAGALWTLAALRNDRKKMSQSPS